MLTELFIKNFAIIDTVRIELERGLNVLTGETGAGKSIIVDALGLVLGDRAQGHFVKAGARETSVEAAFDVTSNPALENIGVDLSDGIKIRRILGSSGKSRSYVNDSMVNIQTLVETGSFLVDVHSQHEHQSLMAREKQMNLLNSFGKLESDLKIYGGLLKTFNELMAEKNTLSKNLHERSQRIDMLTFQVAEIDAASLNAGEKETLQHEQKFLANLGAIKELSEAGYTLVNSADGSISDQAARLFGYLTQLKRYDERFDEVVRMASEIQSYASEISLMLRRYKDEIDFTPHRLDEVEGRLDLIRKLERKYGDGTDAILAYKEEARRELDRLLNVEEKLDSLDAGIKDAEGRLQDAALRISEKRTQTALRLSDDVNAALKELSFKNARFEISLIVNRNEDGSLKYSHDGVDAIEFLFSANPGEPVRPLQKVASGGELSRVMLALKTCLAEVDDVPVLIFDEVDAGIGGETGTVVAEKLKNLSTRRQVLCITHLPQIASRADNHLRVIKNVEGQSVEIKVERLSEEERQRELARMLGGSVTDISLQHARELLGSSKND